MSSIHAVVADLQRDFRHILLNFRQQLKKDAIDFGSFKYEMLHLPASDRFKEMPLLHNSRREIMDATTFEDIVSILNTYWNYLDYRLLEVITTKYRSGKLCQNMLNYSERVEKFKSNFTIDEFIKVWNGRQASPPGMGQLRMQLDRTSKECTLRQVDVATICTHFSLQPSAVLLGDISCDPLTITWMVPSFIMPQLREDLESSNPKNWQLISDYGIAALSIDGDDVYNSQIASLKQRMMAQTKEPEDAETHINTFGYHLVEEISETHVCPITRELLLEPHVTMCCGVHISQSAALKSANQPCEQCGEEELVTKPDKSHQREIKSLAVYCKNKAMGCKWNGELGNLAGHLQNSNPLSGCKFESIPCPDCGLDVQKCTMDEHKLEQCLNRPYDCEYCDYSSTYDDVMAHRSKCRTRLLPCPNSCGCESIQCQDLTQHLADCPLQAVQCKYSQEGCSAKILNRDMADHVGTNFDQHLYMIKQKLETEIAYLKSVHSSFQHLPQIVPELVIYYTKENETTSWFSPPFYTHNGGYRMCLRVDAAGFDNGAGTDVSVYIHLMRGIFDGNLKFPFQGEVTVQLVNQLENGRPPKNHRERTIVFGQEAIHHHGCRVLGPSETQERGWGVDSLVSHSVLELAGDVTHRYVTQVGGQKCMKFRIIRSVVYSM